MAYCFRVNVTVVLRFERDVAGIKALGERVHGEFAVQDSLQVAAVRLAEIELVQLIADDLRGAGRATDDG